MQFFCHGFQVDVINKSLIDPEGSMLGDFTSLDPDSTIESPATQIESPLDCKRNSLAFATTTLHTRMDNVTEPLNRSFELKPAENGQNATEPKLESQLCDRQNADLLSPNLMNVLQSTLLIKMVYIECKK